MQCPKPIKNSYWVIPGRLLAGEYPRTPDAQSSKQRIKAFVDAGFTRFIDLTTPADGLKPYDGLLEELSGGKARRFSFPIPDLSVPSDRARMDAILDAVDTFLNEGRRVYIHCWGGVGRTGTVVGCWLKRHGSGDPLKTLAELWKTCPKSKWSPLSPETEEQRGYIEKLDKIKSLFV